MAKVITAKEAAKLIKDRDVVTFSPDSLVGYPNEIVDAVKERFLEEGHPKDLTTFRAAGMGTFAEDDWGEGAWCLDGMLTRTISSYLAVCPIMAKEVADNEIQGYMLPMGPILQMYGAVGRGMPGVLTKIGMGTSADPRYGGGKLNSLTKEKGEDLVEYIPDFRGEDYLFYKSPGFNVALLRGTKADIHGNISTEKEPINTEMLAVAQAVKASGGIVIVQVEKEVDLHEINPRMVKVPGIYVDYVVVEEHPNDVPQTTGRWHADDYNYCFTGDELVDLNKSGKPLPLDAKKVIMRRAAMELKKGDQVNFGIGVPQGIPSILEECGEEDLVTTISETGVIGGVPATGRDFGCHWNPEVLCDHSVHFNYFDGGCLDMGVFGLSEVDRRGNMNTSYLNGKMTGIGGFTDIAQSSRHVMFIGTFTAAGLKTEIKDGELHITHEGKYKKFVDSCPMITFDAGQYLRNHDSFLIITERCVIRCVPGGGMILEEVAPGVNIQTQILDLCAADLIIPIGGPKLMDPRIFTEDQFTLTPDNTPTAPLSGGTGGTELTAA
ncbi:MAG: malonate decarboxylase subunit alpha [Anaerovoracaceae bacterium]|nr:malonate decarboxylase subunit alpha [Bacillota bacterium]MDY2670488.1 malonate decarboxylase subunit alpha [Anaerovoracaceae bacterium]